MITLTDKSTKFCIMKQEDYLKLGEEHTKKDREITREEVQRREKVLNSHALNCCRMWKTGEDHGHMESWTGSELAKCQGLRIGQNYTCRTRTIRKNLARQGP